jgi:uncharacterized protein (DUF58 family)
LTSITPRQHEADGLSAGLPALMVRADHLAASASLGVHGRKRAGPGESFWQFRRYQSQDAASRIDWRQSAKSQNLYVREREWEAAQTVWFWRDASANMDFASGRERKKERAELLLLALAALLVRGGERVGLMGMDGAPGASRLALSRIGHGLDAPGARRASPPATPLKRGSELVWFSDFLYPEATAAITVLARQGLRGHLVRIIDPAEEDFPFRGRVRFEAAGPHGAPEIFGRAERVRASYRARFAAHGEHHIADTAMRLGWSCTSHRTDHAPQRALIALHAAIGGG